MFQKIGTPEYLGKYKFFRNVSGKNYRVQKDLFTDLLINLILDGIAKVTSMFFNGTSYF